MAKSDGGPALHFIGQCDGCCDDCRTFQELIAELEKPK